jgi:hypothetical protein
MGRPYGTYGGEYRCVLFFLGKTEGKRKLEGFDVDGNIILKYILTKSFGSWAWSGSVWLRIRTSGGLLWTR